jgi:hypothetical protein
MKRTLKAPKKFKINFGPQDPTSKKGYLDNVIRTAGVFTFGIQVEIPDTLAIGLGVAGGITILGFLFYQYLKRRTPEKKMSRKEMH